MNTGKDVARLVELVAIFQGFKVVEVAHQKAYEDSEKTYNEAYEKAKRAAERKYKRDLSAYLKRRDLSLPAPTQPDVPPPNIPRAPSPSPDKSATAYFRVVVDAFRDIKPNEAKDFDVIITRPRRDQVKGLQENERLYLDPKEFMPEADTLTLTGHIR
jgi:hypothetical protein